MNKKEVLDAISQEFRKSLQDIGVTNGDVIKAMFPNAKLTYVDKHSKALNHYILNEDSDRITLWEEWWNTKYER